MQELDAAMWLSAVRVPGLDSVRQVAVGSHYACALHTDGRVRCWGQNESGLLGSGIRSKGAQGPTLVLRH